MALTISTLSILFLTFMSAVNAFDQDAVNFWNEKLPGVTMPATFLTTISPLPPSGISVFADQLISEGTLSPPQMSALCAEAKLICSTKISYPKPAETFAYPAWAYSAQDSVKVRNIFFREHDIVAGRTRKMVPLDSALPSRTFLPASIAKQMPFNCKSLPLLLDMFNIAPNSRLAKDMEHTLEVCGYPVMKGEVSTCAISVESLVGFVNANLGDNVKLVPSTGSVKRGDLVKVLHRATVDAGTGKPAIACHKRMFPFEVHQCHAIDKTKVVMATLESVEDGSAFQATAICHLDTTHWSATHPAFAALGLKAGDGNEICHFTHMENLLWVSN